MDKRIGDVVWAKVSGHPDWPGVISNIEGKKVTVHFVGDNTHTYCDRDKVKAFTEVKPTKVDKWLGKSYKAAAQLKSPVTLEELKEVNAIIISKLQEKKTKGAKKTSKLEIEPSFDEKVRGLFVRLEQKIGFSIEVPDSRRTKLPAIKKSAEILSSFIIQNFTVSEQYTIEDIISVLEHITELDLSKKLLSCTELIKVLKYFRAFLCEKTDQELKKLVRMTEKLLEYFEKLLILNELMEIDDEKVETRDMKKEIRGELLNNLKEKGFSGGSGTKIMKKIESKIKEIDPSQGKVYLEKYRFILEELKKTKTFSLENFIDKICNNFT